MTRTGVFLCTCNQRISKAIDVEQVGGAFAGEALVKTYANLCLPDDLLNLKHDIVENNLERIVVAACPARFQKKHLQTACVEASVNLNRFGLVDWREGCAWAHRGDREGATAQAIDMLRMGVARVGEALPVDGVLTKITPRALVIGGGIAGVTAARAIADGGFPVILVERETELGGRRSVPLNGRADLYEETRAAVLHNPAIQVRVGSRVVAVHGSAGNFRVVIAEDSGTARFEAAVGALVIATGARELRDPRMFRYDGRKVLTLGQFGIRNWGVGTPNSLVYILCAGSRDGHIPYCSSTCCLDSLHQAIRFKNAHPAANVTILFRDFYLLGDESNDEVVREARRAGIEFVRYSGSTLPRVEDEFIVVRDAAGMTRWIGYDQIVLATPQVPQEDAGEVARLFSLARDDDGFFPDPHLRVRPEDQSERGVFVCGSAHRPVDIDTAVMQGMTAAARAARFIQRREVMRPSFAAMVDTRLCTGCAQCVSTCPVGAISLIPDGQLYPHGVAHPAGQVYSTSETRSVIDPFLCLGCGNCLPACPSKAIDLPSASDAMIFAQIEAALGSDTVTRELEDAATVSLSPRPRVVAFCCEWSGVAAMELAGARRMKYSAQVRVVELPCSARLDPMHVLYALLKGAQSVVLALCPPNECHFTSGNRYAEARIERLRAELAAHGIDPQRLQIARMMGDDAGAWVSAIESCMLQARVAARAEQVP